MAIFEGAKDLRSNGRALKEKKVMWTKAQGKPGMTHEKEKQLSDGCSEKWVIKGGEAGYSRS